MHWHHRPKILVCWLWMRMLSQPVDRMIVFVTREPFHQFPHWCTSPSLCFTFGSISTCDSPWSCRGDRYRAHGENLLVWFFHIPLDEKWEQPVKLSLLPTRKTNGLRLRLRVVISPMTVNISEIWFDAIKRAILKPIPFVASLIKGEKSAESSHLMAIF